MPDGKVVFIFKFYIFRSYIEICFHKNVVANIILGALLYCEHTMAMLINLLQLLKDY